jgi:hypothetical protein
VDYGDQPDDERPYPLPGETFDDFEARWLNYAPADTTIDAWVEFRHATAAIDEPPPTGHFGDFADEPPAEWEEAATATDDGPVEVEPADTTAGEDIPAGQLQASSPRGGDVDAWRRLAKHGAAGAQVPPPMLVGSTLENGPGELPRHELDRGRAQVTSRDGGSFVEEVIRETPEEGRRRGKGRKPSPTTAVRVRDPSGHLRYEHIGNDRDAIVEWLCRDGRALHDWQRACSAGRPSADTEGLRRELAGKVSELIEMGANQSAIAATLGRSPRVIRGLRDAA